MVPNKEIRDLAESIKGIDCPSKKIEESQEECNQPKVQKGYYWDTGIETQEEEE